MGIEIKKKGRPPKNGVADPEHLARASMILYAYHNARRRDEKHSAAVKAAVDFVRQVDPGM